LQVTLWLLARLVRVALLEVGRMRQAQTLLAT
jgi:hypothetical protein